MVESNRCNRSKVRRWLENLENFIRSLGESVSHWPVWGGDFSTDFSARESIFEACDSMECNPAITFKHWGIFGCAVIDFKSTLPWNYNNDFTPWNWCLEDDSFGSFFWEDLISSFQGRSWLSGYFVDGKLHGNPRSCFPRYLFLLQRMGFGFQLKHNKKSPSKSWVPDSNEKNSGKSTWHFPRGKKPWFHVVFSVFLRLAFDYFFCCLGWWW